MLPKLTPNSVVKNFSPVKSVYVLSNNKERYVINLTENSFFASHSVKVGDEWILAGASNAEGSMKSVEDKCMEFIKKIAPKFAK